MRLFGETPKRTRETRVLPSLNKKSRDFRPGFKF